ncbi:MAG: TetR/AcrR family transcriptional regulator [Clostridia bacterium]|nr:TetR/AcrR family transcriptional regulator [Clostridia bacterium]
MREANKQKKREQIAAAFIEMVENSSLEEVSTQELCRKAGVSKSTFYRLFPDKYEVAIWIYHSQIDPIVRGAPDLRRSKEWCVYNREEVMKHRRFYRSVASYRGQNSLLEYFADYFYQNIVKYRNPSVPEPTEDQLYAIRMYASVCAQATVEWMLNDYEPSIEEVNRRVRLCRPECILMYFE